MANSPTEFFSHLLLSLGPAKLYSKFYYLVSLEFLQSQQGKAMFSHFLFLIIGAYLGSMLVVLAIWCTGSYFNCQETKQMVRMGHVSLVYQSHEFELFRNKVQANLCFQQFENISSDFLSFPHLNRLRLVSSLMFLHCSTWDSIMQDDK